MALTRQQKKTQKTLIIQREEARAELARVCNERDALKSNVGSLIAEAVGKVQQKLDTALQENKNLVWQLSLDATTMQAKLAESESIRERQAQELDKAHTAISVWEETHEEELKQIAALKRQLAGSNVADNVNLRKRLHAKTQRVEQLEGQLAALTPEGRKLRELGGLRPDTLPPSEAHTAK